MCLVLYAVRFQRVKFCYLRFLILGPQQLGWKLIVVHNCLNSGRKSSLWTMHYEEVSLTLRWTLRSVHFVTIACSAE